MVGWLKNTVYALGISAIGLMGCDSEKKTEDTFWCGYYLKEAKSLVGRYGKRDLEKELSYKKWCQDKNRISSDHRDLKNLLDNKAREICKENYQQAKKIIGNDDPFRELMLERMGFCRNSDYLYSLSNADRLQNLIDDYKAWKIRKELWGGMK